MDEFYQKTENIRSFYGLSIIVALLSFCGICICILCMFYEYLGADTSGFQYKTTLVIVAIIFLVSLIAQYWSGKILEKNDEIIRHAEGKYHQQLEAEGRERSNRARKTTEFTIGERTYELIDYRRKEDKEGISIHVIRARGKRLRASMSRDDGEYIYKYRDEIPYDFRRIIELCFPNWYEKDIEELIGSGLYNKYRCYAGNDSIEMYWTNSRESITYEGWHIIGGHRSYTTCQPIFKRLVRYKPPVPQEEQPKKITIDGFIYRVHPIMEPLDDLSISGWKMRDRGKSHSASMSTEDGEFIYMKRDQIPTDCREICFVFPDWSTPNDRVIYLIWNGSQWVKRYESLNSQWDDSYYFLIYECRSD